MAGSGVVVRSGLADNGGVGGSVRERGSILVNVGAAIKTGGASIGGVIGVGPVGEGAVVVSIVASGGGLVGLGPAGECGLASSVFCSGTGGEGSLVSVGGGNLVASVTEGGGVEEAAAITANPLIWSISVWI